jgi:predicted acetyltransferase
VGDGAARRPVPAVRLVGQDELADWVRCLRIGFHQDQPEGLVEHLRAEVDLDRTWAAFDGSYLCGTLRSAATSLTVPGPASVRAAALSSATVAPTHRRRGALSAMVRAALDLGKEAGEVVSILVAAEYPIYGRFGFGPAIEGAVYNVDVRAVRFRESSTGHVALVEPEVLRSEAPAIYERVRSAQPGAIDRSSRWWDIALGVVDVPGASPTATRLGLYRSPSGIPEGYVRYQAKQDWDQMRPNSQLSIDELVASTPEAYHALWQFCCEVDLVRSLEAWQRGVDEHLPWLLEDGRAIRQAGRFDFIWARLLDVAQALAGRRYATTDGLVVDVVDPGGLTGGRYLLEGGRDGATCTTTTATADLTVPVDVLGAVYLGGMSWHALHRAGRVDEQRNGAVTRAEAMFRSAPAPWCSTWF